MSSRIKALSVKEQTHSSERFLTKSMPIEVNPPEIVFKDIEVNQIYEITVEIRNLTKKAVRIRLQKPNNPNFKVEYNLQQEIAPGLAMLAKIKYESKEVKNENEKVSIVTEDGFIADLPIRVYKMQSQLLFEPFVNMGFVKVGKSKTDKIVFKNEGKATGVVELSHEHAPLLKIEPSILTIAPQEVAYLNITFKSEEAGLFKGVINLKSESMLLKDTIDIHATSVEYSKFFIDEQGNQQTVFDFGNMYVGQFSQIQGFLVNNSPKKLKFRTNFRLGFKISPEQFTFVQSPSELGHEQNERIMHCEPATGEVGSFSQIPIKFICKSKITYKEQIYTKNYAITPPGEEVNYAQSQKLDNEFKPESTHEYSVLFDFYEEEPIILQLKGNTNCPLIKVEKTIFQFGDCASHEHRHIGFKITNVNPSNKIELMFPKIPNFSIEPNHIIMENKSTQELVAAFEPKNIGKFDTTQALILNKIYEIPLRFFGISSAAGKKELGKRGPEGVGKDFEKRKTFVNELPQDDPEAQRKKAFSLTTEKSFLQKVRNSDLPENKLLQLSSHIENRDKYNSVLRDRRTERINHEKSVVVEKKWSLYTQKLKEMGLTKKYEEKQDEEGLKIAPPIDYEFEVGMINTRLTQPKLPLPENRESLFVTRHLGPYEPIENPLKESQKYNPNPNQKPKKVQSDKPFNYNEQRDISSDITSVELEKIEVGPLSIDFGEVFVKSSTSKYFWIRNSTKKSIAARLICDTAPQFKKSYQKTQIIKSCSEAGFEVVLCRDTIGEVRSTLKYILNEKYVFEMTATGKVVPVALQVSRLNLKFSFADDNMEMSTTESLKLINKGNSKAMFKFTLTKERLYVPDVLEGEVEANSTRDIKIKFVAPTPAATKNEYIYTERLLLKILDGVQSTIVCTCTIYEPKLALKPAGIDFGIMCIGQQATKYLNIKHSARNTSTAVQISSEGIEGLKCSDRFLMKNEDSRDVEVDYKAIKEGESVGQITMKVRGSKDRIVECKAKCVNPKITFEELLDYQYVIVAGYPGIKQLTLNNTSEVQVPLIIDLREKSVNELNPEGVECVEIKLLGEDGSLDVVYPEKPQEPEEKSQPLNEQNSGKEPENILNKLELQEDEDLGSDISDDEREKEIDQKELRRFRLVMKPQKEYKLQVKFYAKEVKEYQFSLPLQIERYGSIDSPSIHCKGIQPQFIFDPQIIDFKRKVITTPDKCFPRYINVTLTNPDNKSILWSIDDSSIVKEQIFSLEHKKGRLGPGETFVMKAGFNPYEVGTYSSTLPLYIEDEEVKQKSKYLDVEIKGVASFPSISFSKREVILPVVPLNITTYTSFRIFNDGYENVNLKSQLLDDVANLGLVVSFPEGKNLGITKQKIKVEVSWKFAKPMSFTIKLEFSDDMNRTYVVPVSGTADNCFFTNYAYFLRNEGKYKIDIKESLTVRELEEDEENPIRVRKNSAHSMRSSKTNATNKSLLSYLGSSMIKPGILESTIEYLTRYLNANVLTSRIEQFPRSLIQSDGAQLFEIIAFFTPKGSNFPWRCTIKEKSLKKVEALYNQYCELVKMLKTEGAHLNHIRPEYLLSLSDLNTYLQNVLPKEQSKCYSGNLLKVNNSLYNYLSMDSWISLLYQMFRIYLLSRINLKTYRNHIGETLPGKAGNVLEVPKGYLEGSNYMSASEGILCYWIESIVLEVLLEERRITNFDKDFKDGVLIAVLLQKYANVKILRNMKMLCSNDEDCRQNAAQVVKGLEEIGLNSHIQPKDISSPLQREMLLFLLHLYNYLPFYTPRQEPIEFKCVLGEEVVRNIELTNPSNKPVFYEAKYDGSPDFTLLGETSFKIEAKQSYKFQVKFASRISTPVTGRVTFINRKESSIAAAALVFDLKSNITGKVSEKIWNISGALYEQVDFPIDVVNRFAAGDVADFTVTVLTEYIYEKKSVKPGTTKQLPKDQEVQTIFPKFEIVKLRKNVTTPFQVSFVPTSMHTTKTTLVFSNPNVGEFQHEIVATVEMPAPLQEIKPPMTLTVDQVVNWQLPVQFKNDAMLRARKIAENFKRAGKKTPKDAKRTVFVEETGPVTFYVDVPPNPFVSSKDTITLTEKKDPNAKKKEEELVSSQNKVPLTFVCKNPVYEFSTIVTLRNAEKTDIRRYRVIITVQPKPLKAILEMNVPARSEVTQNLPIVNNTEKDWSIRVTWTPDPLKNGNYFSVPSQYSKEFPVKRKSTGNFPVTFKPKWAAKAEAKLVLMNPVTMDQFEYDIRGNGEEPLAEEHIEIKCESKKKFKKEIIVKNPYQERPVTFNVETDLMNCTGPKTLTIPSGGKEKYEFTVQPMLCGEYTGSITFSEDEGGQYIWYTVSVVTDYPATLKTISLVTEIRKAVIYELEVDNASAESVNYEVIIAGAGLSGQPLFDVRAKSKGKYQLKYLPFRVGRSRGSVCFINPQLGELLYEFELVCEERPVTRIHGIRSPLGVQKAIPLELENPSQNTVTLTISNSNPEIFETTVNTIRLQAGQKRKLQVMYTPSSLDTSEETEIKITSKDIGSWEWSIQGMGLPPVPAQPLVIYNSLFQEQTNILKFRNPFRYDITVGVRMTFGLHGEQVFRLILKGRNNVLQVRANDILEIPFSFIPTACQKYECTITVVISEKIQWTYPIIGVTEVNNNETIVHLRTKCREKVRETRQIFLQGIQDVNVNNSYSYELDNIPHNAAILVEKFFTVEQHKKSLLHDKDYLEFEFSYKPLKPSKFSFDFVVKKAEGPKWRYKLMLEATEPEPDDVIHFESALLVTSSVSFKLTNWQKSEAEFIAKFTYDSANEFSVQPKEGVLMPFGSAGTNFVVSFTPIEYGKERKGKLYVQTADMFWSYLLKGDLPKYNPPKVTASSIDNRSSLQRSLPKPSRANP